MKEYPFIVILVNKKRVANDEQRLPAEAAVLKRIIQISEPLGESCNGKVCKRQNKRPQYLPHVRYLLKQKDIFRFEITVAIFSSAYLFASGANRKANKRLYFNYKLHYRSTISHLSKPYSVDNNKLVEKGCFCR